MPKTIIIALAALLGGAALGFILAGAINKTLFRRVRSLRKQLTGEKKKMSVSNRTLIFVGVLLIAYTIADMFIFWHTGSEPYTLTACVFGVCGLESGVLGWIKTTKVKQSAEAQEPPESLPKRKEPPDVGI